MLIIFMIFLIISSIMVLIVKRNKETLYLFAMCISLATMLIGILIYIAKKGGISRELQNFFFFNIEIKTALQYYLITLGDLGFIIAIGRYLFPMFLLLLAMHYSMVSWVRRGYWLRRFVIMIPLITILVYYPNVFNYLTEKGWNIEFMITYGTYTWIGLFIITAITLLLYEAYSITMKMFRGPFFVIFGFVLSLTILYILYFGQDPAQVYQFYSTTKHSIYYLNAALSVPLYILIVVINIIVAVVGFSSMLKYTKEVFEASRQGEVIRQKSEAVSLGTSVFVHGIKNELLSNRVIYKRIDRAYEEEALDLVQLREYTKQLNKQNEKILDRMEDLYNSVKANHVRLIPVKVHDIINQAMLHFDKRGHRERVEIVTEVNRETIVLADKKHLAEAVLNVLLNACDAVEENKAGIITLKSYEVRLYNVIEITDNGIGMTKAELKQISEPFYSSKNSNSNWGMGLYYVSTIMDEHYGTLRYESKKGYGSTFYMLIPKYQ